MSFVDALKSEIADLERQLEADPTYIKLREAKRLLATYTDASASGTVVSRSSSIKANSTLTTTGYTRPSASGVSALIVATASKALAGRERPTSTKEIMAILASENVPVGGQNPQNVVSSLLSKSPEFISHGRSGWTLVVPEGHETEKVDDADPYRGTSSTLFQPTAEGREAGPGGGT